MVSFSLRVLARTALLSFGLITISTEQLIAASSLAIGVSLPASERGMLDIHQIDTGTGDAACFIFPDRTTMLLNLGRGESIRAPRRGVRASP